MKAEEIKAGKSYRMKNGTVWRIYATAKNSVWVRGYSPYGGSRLYVETPRNLFAADAVEEVTH